MQMKKIINFRLTLTFVIAMMVATIFATYVFVSKNAKLTTFFILLGIFAVIFITFCVFKKKMLLFLSSLFLIAAIPFLSLYFTSVKLNNNLNFENKTVTLAGTVSGNYKFTTSGNLELLIDDVVIDNSHNLNGKVSIYTNPENLDLSKLKSGACLTIKTKLSFFTIDREISKSLSFLNRNIVASGYAMFYNINLTGENNESLKDIVCNRVYENLKDSNVKYADIGYALLFGDSNVLDADLKTSFRATGIAHLLAVSGLNVSIIILIFNFLLKKLKVSYKFNLVLSLIFLSFYCYLCDFSVSVVRASLMALFALYATIRGKAYDNLSVLSLVAILIMIVSPIEMFNISFVLSFSAVLSIMLLAKPISRSLNKVFYSKLADTLSINFAVQIGLLVTNLFYFGKYPVLGVFANLVAVPIATTSFVVLVIGVVLSSILPFMSFVNHGFGLLMDVVVRFNSWIANIGFDLRAGSVPWLSILVMFIFMFVVSDYVFVKKKTKAIVASSLALTCALLFLI